MAPGLYVVRLVAASVSEGARIASPEIIRFITYISFDF